MLQLYALKQESGQTVVGVDNLMLMDLALGHMRLVDLEIDKSRNVIYEF